MEQDNAARVFSRLKQIRCYAKNEGSHWEAFCIDLNLGAQGPSFDAVKSNLDTMIREYLEDVIVGPDQAHLEQLVPRPAPYIFHFKYHAYQVLVAGARFLRPIVEVSSGVRRSFTEPVSQYLHLQHV